MVRKPIWLKSIDLPHDIEPHLRRLEVEYRRVDGRIPVDCLTLIRLWEGQAAEKIYLILKPCGYSSISPYPEKKRESPDRDPYLMVVDTNSSLVIQRVTIAHELAHRLVPNHRFAYYTIKFYCDFIAMRLLCPSPALGEILGKTWLYQCQQGVLPLGIHQRTPEGETLGKTANYFQVPLRDLIQYLKTLHPEKALRNIVAQYGQHRLSNLNYLRSRAHAFSTQTQ